MGADWVVRGTTSRAPPGRRIENGVVPPYSKPETARLVSAAGLPGLRVFRASRVSWTPSASEADFSLGAENQQVAQS
jgi:hypothetical protein